jgi:hypothetical protein
MKQIEEVPPARATRVVEAEGYRPPYLGALIAGLATFALYALTLAPTTAFWDTSEYIATAHMLGIPHPPGNPLFVLLARAWELLLAPTGLSVAVRVNLFSAFMGALAHGCWFLLAHRILAYFSDSRRFRLAGAAAAVLVSATAFTVWNQSNVNEKVYTVSLFTIALLSWLAFRWRDHVGEGKDDNLLLLGFYVLALSVGNHLMAFLAAPALMLFILLVHPKSLANWKLYPTALLAVLLGLSVHLFLPLRAGLDPVINEADPTCESLGGALASVLTLGATGCEELSAALQREQYRKPEVRHDPVRGFFGVVAPRTAEMVGAQVANYFQYFDWQWARSVAGKQSWFGGMRPWFTLLFLAIGAFGAAAHYRSDRTSWAYVFVLFATVSAGLVVYMNFRYGYMYPVVPDLRAEGIPEVREVRERDYFFIASFSLWGLWVGIGLAAAWRLAAEKLSMLRPTLRHADLLTAPVLALALIPLALNWTWASRSDDYAARDWAYNALMSVGPYGVLFTNGDNDTFPLWYLQEVEGIRRDVTVMVLSYLNSDWYAQQLRDITRPCSGPRPAENATTIVCQRPYSGDGAPYASPAHPPSDSVLPLDDAAIAQIASGYYRLAEPVTFRAAQLETTIPAGTVLEPADTFVLAVLQSSLGGRPIHFMAPSSRLIDLGLMPHTVRTGLTLRLEPAPVVPDGRTIIDLPEQDSALLGTAIDLPLTERLLDEVFVARGLPRTRRPWVDAATLNIPLQYAWAHVAAARAHDSATNAGAAAAHAARAEAWAALAQ